MKYLNNLYSFNENYVLGKGVSGIVYQGENLKTGEHIAIKKIEKSVAD
jgi:hypothetical protein